MYYFLFRKLSKTSIGNRWEKESRGCFPCHELSQEADFRKLIIRFLESIEKDVDFHHRKKVAYNNILMAACGTSFVHLGVRVFTFLLTKKLLPESRNKIRHISKQSNEDIVAQIRDNLRQRQQNIDASTLKSVMIDSNVEPIRVEYRNLMKQRSLLKDEVNEKEKQLGSYFDISDPNNVSPKDISKELCDIFDGICVPVYSTASSCLEIINRSSQESLRLDNVNLYDVLSKWRNVQKAVYSAASKGEWVLLGCFFVSSLTVFNDSNSQLG